MPRLWIFLSFFLVACQMNKPAEMVNPGQQFELATATFFNELWEHYPEFAVSSGLHKYDDRLTVFDESTRKRRLQFIEQNLKRFSAFRGQNLTMTQQMDQKLLENNLRLWKWQLTEFRRYQWNPARYNIGSAVDSVWRGHNKSKEQKLRDITKKLRQTPKFYAAAKANIYKPTRVHTELAIKQNRGATNYLKSEILKAGKKSKLSPKQKKELEASVALTIKAINKYMAFLNGVVKNPKKVGGFRSFRFGGKVYQQKFAYELNSKFTADEIYAKALAARTSTHKKMTPIAQKLWKKYLPGKTPPQDNLKMIARVIWEVSKKHVEAKDFVPAVRGQITDLTKFVNTKKLLSLDPKKPLKVKKTPSYLQGYAIAGVDSPGPFEKERETYYYVTPLSKMTKKQQDSFLREYNNYTLQILNIHEAIPGHYAQMVYANQSKSPVQSLFGSGAMIEGWAVYGERMMLEEGYGQQSPELWLMYYKWFLRTVTNTIIDYEIHNNGLSKAKALDYMMTQAFQEAREAELKWERAKQSQVQLTYYFTGFTEIYELREKIKTQLADQFKLREFHERFLSYGSAPVKEIARIMLNTET